MSEKIKITEEMGIHKEWYKKARSTETTCSPGGLSHFIDSVLFDYEHDYGTICHAIAACALAAAHTANSTEVGGITGFQAGAVMWEFITHWMHLEAKPLKLLDYSNMLYPQYYDKFDKTISKSTWEHLQKKAKENLEGDITMASQEVIYHWKSIVGGVVPFGYRVVDDE